VLLEETIGLISWKLHVNPRQIHDRGAAENPPNRFERIMYERDPDWSEADDPAQKTQFFRAASTSIITYNDNPDVGLDASINPYRGYEHPLRSE
jgi:hypothetical protein